MPENEKISRCRQRRYPAYWDYRYPRSAEEYTRNAIRRRIRQNRKLVLIVQRMLGCAAFGFILALLVGWAR